MGELIKMSDLNDNPKSCSPEQLLDMAHEFIQEGSTAKKAIIVLWDDTNDDNDMNSITYFNCGMTKPELVYLLEDIKLEFLSME